MAKRSIFNDVIGPLTRGPSSSHTGASYFIGAATRNLFGEEIDSIKISFDEHGSYDKVYKFQNSEFAFLAGLMDIPMQSHQFLEVKKIAQERNISFQFQTIKIPAADHPNYVILNVISKKGREISITAKSTGGGTILVEKINEWKTTIDGQHYDFFIQYSSENKTEIRSFLDRESQKLGFEILNIQKQGKQPNDRQFYFLQVKLNEQVPSTWLSRFIEVPNVTIWISPPIFFIMKGKQLFDSAKDYLQYADNNHLTLGEAAIEYEMTLLDVSKEEIVAEMEKRVKIMLDSVEKGLLDHVEGLKIIDSTAHTLSLASKKNKLFSNTPNTQAAIRAMASMEIASSGGYICAAPTGGSSGVIPGVLYTLHNDFNVNMSDLIRCAFAAAGIGLIHAIRSTFAAEVAGCQVEIGIAGAMASAAVCEAAGVSCKNAMDAAAICLQNTMGSVCDLVGGICEIPCHTRNAVATSNAFVCCDLVMGGYLNPISLDDSIDASHNSGTMLPSELRCTALGGIAVTPSGLRLTKEKRNENGTEN